MFAPEVYATPAGLPVPTPFTSKVVALVKVIVTVCCRFAFGGGGLFTVPGAMLALPVLATADVVRIGAAAATSAGSLNATEMSRAPLRVGWIRKRSPLLAAPAARFSVTPSTVCGKAANTVWVLSVK